MIHPFTGSSSHRTGSAGAGRLKRLFSSRLLSPRLVVGTLTVAGLLLGPGCHRGYYRRQADAEARSLIREKLDDPRWCQLDPSIDIEPDSRMYDPFSADHPPIPPDDPASHALMHCVDGEEGYPHWHANGDTNYVSNPEWRAWLPINSKGVLDLDLDTAVQLSLKHSPDWQQQKETLYQSALDVSLERFGFDTQAFYGWNTFLRTRGRLAPGGAATTLSTQQGSNGIQLQRLGVTGATLAANLANTIVWNFSGADTQTASTLLDFSLVQPLLRRAGRDRIMESLTQAERTLLANVRQLERWRRGFFLNIVTGRNPGAGPNAGGNFLSDPSGATFNAGGYLGLLRDQQQIRILEFNVQSLQNNVNQFREFFNEERISLLQVRQAETSLYNAQSQLLSSKVSYQDSLDAFKRTLGLSPDVPIGVQDPLLNRFELIQDQLLSRQLEITELRTNIGDVLAQIDDGGAVFEEGDSIEWSEELRQRLENLPVALKAIEPVLKSIREDDVGLVKDDFEVLQQSRSDVIGKLEHLREYIETSTIDFEVEPSILQASSVETVEQLQSELDTLLEQIDLVEGGLLQLNENIRRLLADGPSLTSEELRERLDDDILYETPEIITRLSNQLIQLTLLQARARVDSITLPEIDIDAETAFAVALQFRRDLMNARASLVDRWRRIEFVADDLESTLDLVFEGSVGNQGDNPFRIRWENNQFGVGLRFDAPITRISERNAYRRALIDYQQARRAYYSVEDAINQNMRRTIRAVEQNRVQFELARRSIKVAIQQVELSQLDLIEPTRPGAGSSTLGPVAANNLIQAINSLQQTQTRFVNIWVNFEVLRRGLDFDLGTMQLTPDGTWMDPGTISVAYVQRAAEAVGIAPEEICLPVKSLMPTEASGGESTDGAPAMAPLGLDPDATPVDGLPGDNAPDNGAPRSGIPSLDIPDMSRDAALREPFPARSLLGQLREQTPRK